MDAENNSQQTGTNNGNVTTFSEDGNYQSFWDINNRFREMYYHYQNWTGDWGNPAMLHFRVTPYVGLAYYDEDNNGNYEDPLSGIVANFNTAPVGMYPNMYDPTGNEIGNFMPAERFTITGAGIPTYWGTVELEVFSTNHLHVDPATAVTNIYNPNGVYFNLSAPPAPYVSATTQEIDILKEYGKVHFYYWEAINPTTSAVVRSGYIMADCDTNDTTHWEDTTVVANLPGGGTTKLFYNIYSDDIMDKSYEVVLERGTYPSEETFAYTIGGQTHNFTVSLKTFLGGSSDPVSILKINND